MKSVLVAIIFLFGISTKSLKAQLKSDSLANNSFEKDRGTFTLRVKKFRAQVIGGFYRNREPGNNLQPINFTYNLFLPFQYDFGYKYLPNKEKVIKINTAFIFHHTNNGNHALGMGLQPSFLLAKHLYLNYQFGVVWCEVVKRNTNDGFNAMGFCFHHQFGLSYNITKQFNVSLNAVHISNGNIFKNARNLQDVVGVGVGYSFN